MENRPIPYDKFKGFLFPVVSGLLLSSKEDPGSKEDTFQPIRTNDYS
jgi:hypothetical protein